MAQLVGASLPNLCRVERHWFEPSRILFTAYLLELLTFKTKISIKWS